MKKILLFLFSLNFANCLFSSDPGSSSDLGSVYFIDKGSYTEAMDGEFIIYKRENMPAGIPEELRKNLIAVLPVAFITEQARYLKRISEKQQLMIKRYIETQSALPYFSLSNRLAIDLLTDAGYLG